MLSFPVSGGKPSSRSIGLHPGYVASRIYATVPSMAPTAAAVPAVDVIYLYPFQIFARVAVTALRIRVQTGGAGSSGKGAIWANSYTSMRPLGAPLLVDNTGVATTASTADAVLAASGTLNPGIYWAGTKFTGTLPQTFSVPSNNTWAAFISGFGTASGTPQNAYSFADAYANNMPTFAEGASFTSIASTSGAPLVYLVT